MQQKDGTVKAKLCPQHFAFSFYFSFHSSVTILVILQYTVYKEFDAQRFAVIVVCQVNHLFWLN